MKHIGVSKVYFWISVIFPLLILAGTAAFLLLHWDAVPDRIPTNYSFTGEPTAWGEKKMLWLQPATGLGLYAALLVVSFFPQTWNIRGFGKKADPALLLQAAGGLLADFRIVLPAIMSFLAVWTACGGFGPGWIQAVIYAVPLLVPVARCLLRVYVLGR